MADIKILSIDEDNLVAQVQVGSKIIGVHIDGAKTQDEALIIIKKSISDVLDEQTKPNPEKDAFKAAVVDPLVGNTFDAAAIIVPVEDPIKDPAPIDDVPIDNPPIIDGGV